MADIAYNNVVKLAEQLTPGEQETLARHMQQRTEQNKLSQEAWKKRFEAAISKATVLEEPSPRREDWYDDDGQ